MLIKYYFLSLFFLLTSCMSSHIENRELNDRVIACGSGFSENLSASLAATYQVHNVQGKATGAFKDKAKALIFSEIPPKDRLKAYEDYIRCIETPFKPSDSYQEIGESPCG